MKVALIGASGFVGQHILTELLDRNHHVTAIVRQPDKLDPATFNHGEHLQVLKANVMETNTLAGLIKGHDAVINAFNAGWTNPNLYDDFMKGSESIQAAVKAAGIKRYISIGGAGSLYLPDGSQLVDSPDFPEDFKPGAQAARDYLTELLNEKELDWTFISPAIEMNPTTAGVKKGHYRQGLEQPVFDENDRSVISVEDLALAIVDELENPKNIGRRFTVGY